MHFYLSLVLMGAAWGAVFPIIKIAVSTGYKPYGIMVWQLTIGLLLSGFITLMRGKSPLFSIRYFWIYLGIATLGTVVPNYFSYTATAQLPAGIVAIVITLVPLFALPISIVLKLEKPSWPRFLGVGLGAVSVALLVGPDASLPEPSKVWFVFLAMGAAVAYAAEGNFLTWYGSRGLDALQILFGACAVGLVMAVPIAILSHQFVSPFHPWGVADWAVLGGSVLNWLTYAAYVWLIGRAGPVFAAQVSYLVTGFGVVWSMLFLGESYSLTVWLAFVLMLVGVFLVQPRQNAQTDRALVPEPAMGKDSG